MKPTTQQCFLNKILRKRSRVFDHSSRFMLSNTFLFLISRYEYGRHDAIYEVFFTCATKWEPDGNLMESICGSDKEAGLYQKELGVHKIS